MEFWNKLGAALKQKGFSAVQIKKLQEAFGHLNAAELLRLSVDQLLPAMTGRTVAEKREKIETLQATVREVQPQQVLPREVLPREALPNKGLPMAMFSYLQFKAGGEDAPVLYGEDNTRNNVGDRDVSAWLECSAFEVALDTGQQGTHGSSQSTGHRVWRPARFVLRVGKSTPWLFDAARMNKSIDLVLHLFAAHWNSGQIEQHFQYRIQQGRITSLRLVQPDVLDPSTAHLPHRVELSVVPNVSEMESFTGGTMMVDNWAELGVA